LRLAGVTAVGLTLCACSSMAGVGAGHSGGIATYDDLKAATAACTAKGGQLKLQRNGDPQYLEDYACEKK
jgi:hypothetical protein